MKSTMNLLVAALALFAISSARADLSPRALANEVRIASGGSDANLVRSELGAGARTKAAGGFSEAQAHKGAKDADFVRRQNALGVAAQDKANSGSKPGRSVQIAPLK